MVALKYALTGALLLVSMVAGAQPPNDASPERRQVLAAILKEKLIDEMAKTEFKAETNGRHTTTLKTHGHRHSHGLVGQRQPLPRAVKFNVSVTSTRSRPGSRRVRSRPSITGEITGRDGQQTRQVPSHPKPKVTGKVKRKTRTTDKLEPK